MTWGRLNALRAPLWLKSTDLLRLLIEEIARNEFAKEQDPEFCSLLYVILGKQKALRALWKSTFYSTNPKMADFLSHDFTQQASQSMASKNAFSSLGKRRFYLAAMFFLLAGRPRDAVQVCCEKLGDPMLALVVLRLLQQDERVVFDICPLSVGESAVLKARITGASVIDLLLQDTVIDNIDCTWLLWVIAKSKPAILTEGVLRAISRQLYVMGCFQAALEAYPSHTCLDAICVEACKSRWLPFVE